MLNKTDGPRQPELAHRKGALAERILLIEDDDRIARAVTATLSAAGYSVERVIDGENAWFKGDTEDYDAVILDLGLPSLRAHAG